MRKRDSKGAYYSIINDLKLTDKEDFRKYLRMNTSTFQVILQVAHCLSKSSLQFMLVSLFTSWNSENKRTYSAKERLHYDLLKKSISVWWIKSNLSDFIHYTEIVFLNKNVIFLYIPKIFFTMLLSKIFLEYWLICIFQNIVVGNEPLKGSKNIYKILPE